MNKNFNKQFLTNTDETGRCIVKDLKTGKNYYIETISNYTERTWGDVDPVTKKITGEYGSKYNGAVSEKDSLITEENGFIVHTLNPGQSPDDFIEKFLAEGCIFDGTNSLEDPEEVFK